MTLDELEFTVDPITSTWERARLVHATEGPALLWRATRRNPAVPPGTLVLEGRNAREIARTDHLDGNNPDDGMFTIACFLAECRPYTQE